jgi:hypothetical protein
MEIHPSAQFVAVGDFAHGQVLKESFVLGTPRRKTLPVVARSWILKARKAEAPRHSVRVVRR